MRRLRHTFFSVTQGRDEPVSLGIGRVIFLTGIFL